MAQQRKVAFITGGSRGIGMECAIHLAKRGLDIVVASRTLHPGEAHEQSATIREKDVRAMPGSLEETAKKCEAYGVKALPVKLDLLVRKECETAVGAAMKRFGRIDVLVNNGRYYGPGQMDIFEETDMEFFDKAQEANVHSALYLIKLTMPSMIKNGSGVVVNLTSSSGSREVAAMPREGGWGLNYSITKAAIARASWGLAKELRKYKIAIINMSPGDAVVERRVHEAGKYGFSAGLDKGLPPSIAGAACAFLATHPNAMYFSGQDFEAYDVCVRHELVDPTTLAPSYRPEAWGVPRAR